MQCKWVARENLTGKIRYLKAVRVRQMGIWERVGR